MLSSCSDKGYWEEAPLEQGLSFACATYNETLSPGENEFVIPIQRTVNATEQTVNVTFTPGANCPADITIPTQATFAAGSNTANLVIKVANATPPYIYSGTLKLDGDASYAGNTTLTLNCPVNYTWVSLGIGTFLDAFVMGDVDPFPVEIQKAEGFERYRVLSPYVQYYATIGADEEWKISDGSSYIEFWENNSGTLSFNAWATGLGIDGEKDKPINAYPWNAYNLGFVGDYDIWYQPGVAMFAPAYICVATGNYWLQSPTIQIELPE